MTMERREKANPKIGNCGYCGRNIFKNDTYHEDYCGKLKCSFCYFGLDSYGEDPKCRD